MQSHVASKANRRSRKNVNIRDKKFEAANDPALHYLLQLYYYYSPYLLLSKCFFKWFATLGGVI